MRELLACLDKLLHSRELVEVEVLLLVTTVHIGR